MSKTNKVRTLSFRLAEDDYRKLMERCRKAELSKSMYLRYLIRIPIICDETTEESTSCIVLDKRSIRDISRELTRWGYHYNQAVHAMNLINFHARHGHVDRDLVAESIPTIEHELADVNAAAREMAAELGRIGADSLVEGSPCRS